MNSPGGQVQRYTRVAWTNTSASDVETKLCRMNRESFSFSRSQNATRQRIRSAEMGPRKDVPTVHWTTDQHPYRARKKHPQNKGVWSFRGQLRLFSFDQFAALT